MTNFEKWKRDLTLDDFLDLMSECSLVGCHGCAIYNNDNFCKEHWEECRCSEWLTVWANTECEDNYGNS